MHRIFLVRSVLFFCAIAFCVSGYTINPTYTQQPKPAYSYRIMAAKSNTFGYQIFKGEKMMIEQPTIPGVSGGLGFLDEKQAVLVAQKVIQKLNDGIFPPQVSQEELKLWGITIQPKQRRP